MIFISCSSLNTFTTSRIINGNTIVLNNGVRINLTNVSDDESNIKILEHYLTGDILLFDSHGERITNFSSDSISAIIYNSEGDCINELLVGVSQISIDEKPVVEDTPIIVKTIVNFDQENGTLKIPAIINGIKLYFIFDTGASLITISNTEAAFQYRNGLLSKEDFIGVGQFADANGDISEGMIINLRSVIIGDRELNNVQACVIEGQNAPLLLGQSAMKKFGKVSIDYQKSEIIFE